MKIKTIPALLSAFLALQTASFAAGAADETSGEWQYEFTPYIFTTGLDGTIGVRGVEVDIDAGFSDLTDFIDKAFMAVFEARKDEWGFGFDAIYTELSNEESRDWECPLCLGTVSGEIEVSVTQEIYTLVAAYRIRDDKTKVDLTAAARYTRIDNEIDLSITPAALPGGGLNADKVIDWWDPLVGVRVLHPFAKNWTFVGFVDVGGFGVGSDSTYQALLGVNWEFAPDYTARLGYRYLYQDYEEDDIVWDMAMEGVFLGLGFAF